MSVIQYDQRTMSNVASLLLQGVNDEERINWILDNLNILCAANAQSYSQRYNEKYEPTVLTVKNLKMNYSMSKQEKLDAIKVFRMIPYQCNECLTDFPVPMKAYHDLSKIIMDRAITSLSNTWGIE